MREEKILVRILRDLANLVADEASKNTEFASRLEAIVRALPDRRKEKMKLKSVPDEQLPDLFIEAKARGQDDFEQWLAELEIPILKALVRKHDFDSSKRTQKWRESEKFAKLISDQMRARMQRGAAFLTEFSEPEGKQ